MTVRLRLTCNGKTSEYLFDRAKITLGRGPFNDLVIATGDVGMKHGALLFEEARALRFVIERASHHTTIVRDGEILADVEAEQSADIELRGGDSILFASAAARIEILSARQQPVEVWEEHALGELLRHPPSAEMTTTFLGVSEALAMNPGDLGTLLEQCARLCEVALDVSVRRAVVSLFTDSEEFLDDTWALDLATGPDEQHRFDVSRSPLSRFGGEGTQRARALLTQQEVFLLGRGERTMEGQVIYIGLPSHEERAGVLAIEIDAPRDPEAIAPLARSLRSLAALCGSIRNGERRARALDEENRYFRERERRHYLFKELVCESPRMKTVYRHLNHMVDDRAPVLVSGEAGSGKELIGRALHHLGSDREGMFISVHCGAMPEENLGVEMFGCAASALVGALAARKGVFELAYNGTVYLEELDLLSPMLQGKLVRMLKEGEVRRLGDSVGRRVSARLVVSTHRPARELIAAGKLRHDLFLLLKEQTIKVPPLRHRAEDLLPLATMFLKKFARRYDKRASELSDEVCARMNEHDWPGNVRELQSFIEAAVLKCAPDAVALTLDDLHI